MIKRCAQFAVFKSNCVNEKYHIKQYFIYKLTIYEINYELIDVNIIHTIYAKHFTVFQTTNFPQYLMQGR